MNKDFRGYAVYDKGNQIGTVATNEIKDDSELHSKFMEYYKNATGRDFPRPDDITFEAIGFEEAMDQGQELATKEDGNISSFGDMGALEEDALLPEEVSVDEAINKYKEQGFFDDIEDKKYIDALYNADYTIKKNGRGTTYVVELERLNENKFMTDYDYHTYYDDKIDEFMSDYFYDNAELQNEYNYEDLESHKNEIFTKWKENIDNNMGEWDAAENAANSILDNQDNNLKEDATDMVKLKSDAQHPVRGSSDYPDGNPDTNPKIDIFVNGEYVATTKWSKTAKSAKESYLKKYPELTPEMVKTRIVKEEAEEHSNHSNGQILSGVVSVKVSDIDWDCDGENPENYGLPKEIELKINHDGEMDLEDEISNELSNNTGFCHNGFNYEIIG